jgi:hypothetical protein
MLRSSYSTGWACTLRLRKVLELAATEVSLHLPPRWMHPACGVLRAVVYVSRVFFCPAKHRARRERQSAGYFAGKSATLWHARSGKHNSSLPRPPPVFCHHHQHHHRQHHGFAAAFKSHLLSTYQPRQQLREAKSGKGRAVGCGGAAGEDKDRSPRTSAAGGCRTSPAGRVLPTIPNFRAAQKKRVFLSFFFFSSFALSFSADAADKFFCPLWGC